MPTFELPLVFRDIADKLIADDWFKVMSDDGLHSYYVIGAMDYSAERASGARWLKSAATTCGDAGPLAESFVRSQVADRRDYLNSSRKQLEEAGGSTSKIDRMITYGQESVLARWIDGDQEALPDELHDLFGVEMADMTPKQWTTVIHFLDALAITKSEDPYDKIRWALEGDAQERKTAREKICLREISTKYQKIVERWERLEPLLFDDLQLFEASKAYLYGFYRAAVLLSAAAIEKQLQRIAGSKGERSYRELVYDVAAHKTFDRVWIDQARAVSVTRNKVAHDDYEPSRDEAYSVLINARDVLTKIHADDVDADVE